MKSPILTIALSLSLFAVSCKEKTPTEKDNPTTSQNVSGNIKTEELKTEINGVTHRSFAAYNPDIEGKLPVHHRSNTQ